MTRTMTGLFEKTFSNREDLIKSQVANECKRIITKLEKEPSYPDTKMCELTDGSLVDDLELSFLWLYLQMCYAQGRRIPDEEGVLYREVEDTIFDSFPCRAYYSDKYRALLIDTPAVLGSYRTHASRAKENLVKDLVLLSVRRYLSVSGKNAADLLDLPFAVCLYRRCLGNLSSASVPDIDNIEARKIINVLVRELDLDDSYSCLITSVNSIEFIQGGHFSGTSVLLVSEEKRNALENRFLSENRSFDFLRGKGHR